MIEMNENQEDLSPELETILRSADHLLQQPFDFFGLSLNLN